MVDQCLSIIIPVWNGRLVLPDCLDALEEQHDSNCEIIAVDNGSADGSAELIADRYPAVRLFRNAQNLGFAQACNRGMRAATGEVLVLLNQDTRVEPGWLAALRPAFAHDDVGIVGCRILSAADHSLQHAGGYVHTLLAMPFHYGKDDPDSTRWEAPSAVEYVTGAAMAIPRHVIEQVGGFDERFFPAYYEDVDLCFRVRAAGFKVLYWPDAVVLHHESTSTPDETRWFYFQRGRIRFVLKHWPFDRLVGDFAEAETGFQTVFRRDFGNTRPLRLAYTAARIEAAAVAAERWPGDGRKLAQINELLRRLHSQVLSAEFAQIYPGKSLTSSSHADLDATDLDTANLDTAGLAAVDLSAPVTASSAPQTAEHSLALPPLAEFEFRSTIPILGRLVVAFRRAWYAMAAKWALRYLMGQQNTINHVLSERLQQLEDRTAALAAQQETMARQFAIRQAAIVQHFTAQQDAMIRQFTARQDALVHHFDEHVGKLQDYLAEREAHATAVNRFLLDNIAQTEEETIFALLWPLRWDIVLDSPTSQKDAI